MSMDEQLHDDITELRADVANLRGDFREVIAELRGSLATLAATKHADHERLAAKLDAEAYNRRHTDVAVRALHDRLDRYPNPDVVHETVGLARANQLGLAKLVTAVTFAGVLGGSSVVGLQHLLGA